MIEIIVSKRCTKCHEVKPMSGFRIDANGRDGYRTACKECMSADDVRRYAANKEAGHKRAPRVCKPKAAEPRPLRVQPAWAIPTHDYTEADVAWRATRIPAERRMFL